MSDIQVEKTRFVAGTWEGVVRGALQGEDAPDIHVTLLGEAIEHSLTADPDTPGQWVLRVPVKAEHLNDGVQVFLIQDRAGGSVLASFTLITGEPLEDDIRVEVELLRAELDMLKRAFRRHCLEVSQ